ncbi:hypothetical protein BFF78_37645 [Streptomyces fodineus]|uniref:Uncharacterized protein n=1 Tax=Streptomyces fodineus TaxID=1904616 RepID=A0A1D7YKY6_9ACTN|nr:hypothetical protein BFF78_37645 [Streptomyces fodineus]
MHDPGKILLDVALTEALGGYCLVDVAMLRSEPGVFGPVTSDPTVSSVAPAAPPWWPHAHPRPEL